MLCIRNSLSLLQRQMMDQQLGIEERSRADGGSGIKQNRVSFGGTRPYFRETYTGKRFGALHNHADTERTVGLGELIAVINGIQFTTRHNDYELRMPQFNNKSFLSTVEIPFPDVPPTVLEKTTIDEQITEMREYFRAWKNSDTSIRDYSPYFTPVLVYMEGWWSTDSHTLSDFRSTRHAFNAKSWEDLWQKYKFTAEAGRKEAKENIGYLPTKLYKPNSCDDSNKADACGMQLAQWNYRILGFPIPKHIPLNRFRLHHDDLAQQMTWLKRFAPERLYVHRGARFQLNPDNKPWEGFEEQKVDRWELLDMMMSYVPGLDNGGNMKDNAFDRETMSFVKAEQKLNACRYHRKYKEDAKGAMGSNDRFRFFNDDQLFMAMNSQEQVAETCINNQCKSCEKKCTCQRWSYAIPIEVVYMTPLSKWNPYKLQHFKPTGRAKKTNIPNAGGERTGDLSFSKAYNGTDLVTYYRTPSKFYGMIDETEEEADEEVDAADTSSKLHVGVIGSDEQVYHVAPSGIWDVLPEIKDVGRIRQRYPIMPVFLEAGSVGKELRTLQDIVLDWRTQKTMYRDQLNCGA